MADHGISQAGAIAKRCGTNTSHALGDGYTGQRGHGKRHFANISHSAGNADAPDIAPLERSRSDARDRQALDYFRDGHRTAWACVSRDRDRSICDDVIELGMDRCWQ